MRTKDLARNNCQKVLTHTAVRMSPHKRRAAIRLLKEIPNCISVQKSGSHPNHARHRLTSFIQTTNNPRKLLRTYWVGNNYNKTILYKILCMIKVWYNDSDTTVYDLSAGDLGPADVSWFHAAYVCFVAFYEHFGVALEWFPAASGGYPVEVCCVRASEQRRHQIRGDMRPGSCIHRYE